MSATRKQLRKVRRRLAMQGVSNETAQAAIDAMNTHTAKVKNDITDEVLRKVKEKFEPDIRAKAMGDLILLMCGYLHIDCGYGKIRLVKWLRGFCEFADAVVEEGGQSDLRQLLLDECKFDLVKEFAGCAKLSGEEKNNVD